MKNQKKLPLIFWVLIYSAGIVLIVLCIGTVLENKSSISKFFEGQQQKTISPVETNVPLPKDVKAPLPEQQLAPTEISKSESKCEVKSFDLGEISRQRLVGWGNESTDFTLWTLDKESQSLLKWTVSREGRMIRAESKSLICKDSQQPGCIYVHSPDQKVSDAYFQNGVGYIKISKGEKASRYLPARFENGFLKISNSIGICGQFLGEESETEIDPFIAGADEKTSLLVFLPQLSLLLKYEFLQSRSYSSMEVPTPPTNSWFIGESNISKYDCANVTPTRAVSFFSLNEKNLAVLSKTNSFLGASQISLFKDEKDDWQFLRVVETPNITAPIDRIFWKGEETISIGSANFFKTQAHAYIQTISGIGDVQTSNENLFPVKQVLAREDQNQKVPKSKLTGFAYIDLSNPERAGMFWTDQSQLSFAEKTEEASASRVFWSLRSSSVKLVFYQTSQRSPIHLVEVSCEQ